MDDSVVSAQEIVRRIHAEMPLEPSDPNGTSSLSDLGGSKPNGGKAGTYFCQFEAHGWTM